MRYKTALALMVFSILCLMVFSICIGYYGESWFVDELKYTQTGRHSVTAPPVPSAVKTWASEKISEAKSFAKSASEPTCDACSDIALENLMSVIGFDQDNEVEFYNDYSQGPDDNRHYTPQSGAHLNVHEKRIKELRVWASGLKDAHEKSAYLGWLDYYQDGVDEARKEYANHSYIDEMNDYQQAQLRCSKSEQQYKATHKMSVPPRER